MNTDPQTDPRVKHLRDAQRRLRSALIANADRLDKPFTDDPDKNPWDTFVRPAMRELKAAVDAIAAMPAAPVAAPPTGQAGLRDQITKAIADALKPRYGGPQHNTPGGLPLTAEELRLHRAQPLADAVLSVLPAPVDRAAVLLEEAARIRAHCPDHLDSDSAEGAWLACHCAVADDMLRRLAAETPGPETQGGLEPRADYEATTGHAITCLAVAGGASDPDCPACNPKFGVDGCTCIPFTRQDGTPRYCGPTDTVDMISGWEPGADCPHHAPARAETGSALARYIVEQPVSVVQAALRVLGFPPLRFEFELADDPATPPAVVAEPGKEA